MVWLSEILAVSSHNPESWAKAVRLNVSKAKRTVDFFI